MSKKEIKINPELFGFRKLNNKTKKRPHKWSLKYKRSIDCSHPRGFSQRQHCKYGRKNTIKRH